MTDRGSVSLVVVSIVAVALVLIMTSVGIGLVVDARAQAQIAADAAALAAAPLTFDSFGAAGSPRAEAERLAALNGAVLISCECEVNRSWNTRTVEVEVTVQRQILGVPARIVAAAQAEFSPVDLLR